MGRCIYLRKGEVHTAPVVGIKAGDLPIGQIVKLMEGGVETEFIVVNQGIPENSSLYDASCNGTWLLRKDIKENRVWQNGNVNIYESSDINTYLNSTFVNLFDNVAQKVIKQVKIPYRQGGGSGGTDQKGVNGLSCKVFLLSGYEVGWTLSDDSSFPVDGAKLAYFGVGTVGNNKRIAYLNSSVAPWWLRFPFKGNTGEVWRVNSDGGNGYYGSTYSYGIRPCLIIPSTSIFDPTTYLLKK